LHDGQPLHAAARRRQIILPAPLSLARGKLGIAALHFFFEVHAHAGHHLEVLDHRLADTDRDRFALGRQFLQRHHQFRLEIRIIHIHEQVLLPAFGHEVTDSFVHGDACRRHQARH
jgi:hypothetical protein